MPTWVGGILGGHLALNGAGSCLEAGHPKGTEDLE